MSVGTPGIVAGVTDDDSEESEELPAAFIAFTVKLTAVPFVKPDRVAFNTLPTVTGMPTDGITVYPTTSAPPFEAGAVQETVADALEATAETPVGDPGTDASEGGVTAAGANDAEELPEEFIAVTVNVTGVPSLNTGKLAVRTLPTVKGGPTEGVIMYPVIGEPPVTAGAVQETVAELIPGTTEMPVGAEGSVATGVTAGG